MPKSLGQLHTANFTRTVASSGTILQCDLPGALTEQLQEMVRCGNYFKVVGIDMSLTTDGTTGGGQVSGFIRYYAPTRGRCNAFKGAFKAMVDIMDLQGIKMRDNKLYDFRAPLNDTVDGANPFRNQATLDGSEGLALYNTTEVGASIFDVHNRQQIPQYGGATGDIFKPGFDTLIQGAATGTDFVLEDTAIWSGNSGVAITDYETIPFMMSWTPDSTDIAIQFQWRPDPALYLAVLCGQLQVYVEEIEGDPEGTAVELNVAIHVSGWKSIMGNPDKKRRKSRRRSRGRKK